MAGAEVVDRELGRDHRSLAGGIGKQAGLIVEHADLDDAAGNFRPRRAAQRP
jgi:hypothetical protein